VDVGECCEALVAKRYEATFRENAIEVDLTPSALPMGVRGSADVAAEVELAGDGRSGVADGTRAMLDGRARSSTKSPRFLTYDHLGDP
jgi:hypothetical protein